MPAEGGVSTLKLAAKVVNYINRHASKARSLWPKWKIAARKTTITVKQFDISKGILELEGNISGVAIKGGPNIYKIGGVSGGLVYYGIFLREAEVKEAVEPIASPGGDAPDSKYPPNGEAPDQEIPDGQLLDLPNAIPKGVVALAYFDSKCIETMNGCVDRILASPSSIYFTDSEFERKTTKGTT